MLIIDLVGGSDYIAVSRALCRENKPKTFNEEGIARYLEPLANHRLYAAFVLGSWLWAKVGRNNRLAEIFLFTGSCKELEQKMMAAP